VAEGQPETFVALAKTPFMLPIFHGTASPFRREQPGGDEVVHKAPKSPEYRGRWPGPVAFKLLIQILVEGRGALARASAAGGEHLPRRRWLMVNSDDPKRAIRCGGKRAAPFWPAHFWPVYAYAVLSPQVTQFQVLFIFFYVTISYFLARTHSGPCALHLTNEMVFHDV